MLAIVDLVRTGNRYVVVRSCRLRRGRLRRESVLFLLCGTGDSVVLLCGTGDTVVANRRFLHRNAGVMFALLLRKTGVWIFGDATADVDAAVLFFFLFLHRNAGVVFTLLLRRTGAWICGDATAEVDAAVLPFLGSSSLISSPSPSRRTPFTYV